MIWISQAIIATFSVKISFVKVGLRLFVVLNISIISNCKLLMIEFTKFNYDIMNRDLLSSL